MKRSEASLYLATPLTLLPAAPCILPMRSALALSHACMAKGCLQEGCCSAKARSEVRRSQHPFKQSPCEMTALTVPC